MRKLVYLLIAACAVAACSQKEIAPADSSFPSSDSKKFYASVEGSGTKVYNVGNNLYWVDGDDIAVFDKSTSYDTYTFTASSSDTYSDEIQEYISQTAKFELSTPAADAGNQLDRIYAVYPIDNYVPPVANDDGSLDVLIWDDQSPTWGDDKIDTEYSNVVVAVSDDENLNFKNVCGYLRIPLLGDGAELSEVAIYSNSGENLTGIVNVSFDGSGIPVVNNVVYGYTHAYRQYGWGGAVGPTLSTSEPLDVIFCIIPGTLTDGFTAEFYDSNGGKFEASVSNPVEIKRNIMTSTAPILADFAIPVVAPAALPYLEDFEDTPAGWSFQDADGDGFNWEQASNAGVTAHSGQGALVSASYDDEAQEALTPNNWAFSCPIQLATDNILTFWIGAQDPVYCNEHYAVYIFDSDPTVSTAVAEILYEDTLVSSAMKKVKIQIPSSYSGKVVWIGFRHFNCTDMYYINLDDVSVEEGILGPEYVPSYEDYVGEWKDGTAVITIEPKAVGESYSVSGLCEQGAFEVEAKYESGNLVLYEQVVDEEGSSSVALKGLTSEYNFYLVHTNSILTGTYDPDEDAINVISATGFKYYCFIFYEDGQYADNTAVWDLPVVLKKYVSVPDTNTYVFKEDFETGGPDWTLIDSDGDMNNWYASFLGGHYGYGILTSASYNKNALNPDNWAFTPAITFTSGNYISFWVAAQDPVWPAEHYAVYITDAGAPSADESVCVKIMEETIGQAVASETEEVGNLTYRRFIVEVPAEFAGKTGYIGFRHFNCTDMFRINLDDVYVTEGIPMPQAAPSSNSLPAHVLKAAPAKPASQKFSRAGKKAILELHNVPSLRK